MSLAVFVTGTDTDCGKTRVSCALLAALARAGYSVTGMKPVATGATRRDTLLIHDDVQALVAASNVAIPRRYVNPYLFTPACAPHIAAHQTATTIKLAVIQQAFAICQSHADAVVIEGAGGWCVLLAEDLWVEQLVVALKVPVLLVVGIRLGCINHAVLSARAIAASGAPLIGWVANVLDPATYALDAVIATLTKHIPAPRLGLLEWSPTTRPADQAPQLRACVEALRTRPSD